MKLNLFSKKKAQPSLEKQVIQPSSENSYTNGLLSNITPKYLKSILDDLFNGDPREFLALAESFEEHDPHYISVLGVRKKAIITIEPKVVNGNDASQQALNNFLNQPFFNTLVLDLLDAIAKGFAVCEVLWQGGDVVNYVHLPAYLFSFNNANKLQVWNKDGDKLIDLPLQQTELFAKKFLVHAPRSKSTIQIRNGLAIPASQPLLYKSFALRSAMRYTELFGMPLRIGTYDHSATSQDISTLKQGVKSVGTDFAAIMPENMKIEFVQQARTSGNKLYLDLIDFFDKQISKLVLGQTMTSDNGSSRAQADVHNEVRQDIIKADIRELEATINTFAVHYIDQVVGPQKEYPQIKWYLSEVLDKVAIADALQKTAGFDLNISKKDIIEKLGFKEAKTADDSLKHIQSLQSKQVNNQTVKQLNNQVIKQANKQAIIDDLMKECTKDDELEALADSLVNPLVKALESSNSFKEAHEKLSKSELNDSDLQTKLTVDSTASGAINE